MINIELIFSRVRGIYKQYKECSAAILVTTSLFYSRLGDSYYKYLALSDINKENIWLLYKITLSSNNDVSIIIFCETFRDKLSYDDLTKISHDYINKYLEENNIHIIICLEYLYRYFDFDKSKYELMGIFQ